MQSLAPLEGVLEPSAAACLAPVTLPTRHAHRRRLDSRLAATRRAPSLSRCPCVDRRSLENGACHAELKPRRVDRRARLTAGERRCSASRGPSTATTTSASSSGPGRSTSWTAWTTGRLKHRLSQCKDGPFHRTDFSIGHRGAALQFPEHSKESYEAAARMGAGIVECDVTFTGRRAGVPPLGVRPAHDHRHRGTPLNAKCSVPWTGPLRTRKCCTSDLTLAEFKTLRAKMDASVPAATHAGGLPGRHRLLAHRPLHRPRHADDAAREHRAQRAKTASSTRPS